MKDAKEQYLESKPNWEAVVGLRDLEKVGYERLAALIQADRYSEACQVCDILGKVGII